MLAKVLYSFHPHMNILPKVLHKVLGDARFECTVSDVQNIMLIYTMLNTQHMYPLQIVARGEVSPNPRLNVRCHTDLLCLYIIWGPFFYFLYGFTFFSDFFFSKKRA